MGISKRDSYLLKKDFHLQEDEPDKPVKGGFPKNIIPIDFTFESGEFIDSLEVISSPGHTPGAVSFLNRSIECLLPEMHFKQGRPCCFRGLKVAVSFS